MKTYMNLVNYVILFVLVLVPLLLIVVYRHYYVTPKVRELKTVQPLLQKYIDTKTEVVWVPNYGNGGDALIAQGTKDFFNKIGLKYQIGGGGETYKNRVLMYGGGGNIVGTYMNGESFIRKNLKQNTIIILPHTIKDVDEMLSMFKPTDIVITRELKSYNYVMSVIPHKNNVYLSKDMAFYIDMKKMPTPRKGRGHLNFFRTDVEKKKGFHNPANNVDLSNKINYDPTMRDLKKVHRTTYEFLEEINKHETVSTNRLHGGIGSYLMKKNVVLHDNSYGKNKAVYDYSLKQYPNVTFVE